MANESDLIRVIDPAHDAVQDPAPRMAFLGQSALASADVAVFAQTDTSGRPEPVASVSRLTKRDAEM